MTIKERNSSINITYLNFTIMKWNKFLLAALLGIGLVTTSCSDNNDPESGGGTTPGGDSFLAVKIDLSAANGTRSTRATENETDSGTANEQKIDTALIVLYNNNAVAYAFDLTVTATGASGTAGDPTGSGVASGTKEKFTTVARKVKKQDYKLLVVLNPTGKIKAATAVGQGISVFEAAQDESAENLTNSGFVMSNASGLIDIPSTSTNFQATAAAAEASPVALNVERAVAKVAVFFKGLDATSVTKPTDVTISDIKWGVDIINKKTFWRRHLTFKVSNNQTGTKGDMETVDDYTSTGRQFLYAEDPNFKKETTPLWLDQNFKAKIEPDKDLNPINELRPDDHPFKKYEYVLENTMEEGNKEMTQEVTTRVNIRLKYQPNSTLTGSFYRYGGSLLIDAATMKNYADGTTTIPSVAEYTGLDKAITAAKANEHKFDGTEAKGYKLDESTASGKEHGRLDFYKDGLAYYVIPIRHFNNTDQPKQLGWGRFGVVRNNVYKLTLNSVKKLGEPEIPNPTDPDDEDNYLSVQINVAPWFVREQGIDIE